MPKTKKRGCKMNKKNIKVVEKRCYKSFRNSLNKPHIHQQRVYASFIQTRT